MINYPETFGMAWAGSPDPVDFRAFVSVDLYHDTNFFYDEEGMPRNSIRDDKIKFSLKDWVDMETVLGEGGQYQSFEAVFGRKDNRGTPEQLFDRTNGTINKKAFEHWEKYDINLFIQDRYAGEKEKLNDKLNIVVAHNDMFYLDRAVGLLDTTLREMGIRANIIYLEDVGHNTWTAKSRAEMVSRMDDIFLGSNIGK